jgi:hypothetical protein
MNNNLLKVFPQEIVDKILMDCSIEYILKLGKEDVSEYVWSRKIDKDLRTACKNGNLIVVKYYVEDCKVDINKYGSDALLEAINIKHSEIIEYLTSHGAIYYYQPTGIINLARLNNFTIMYESSNVKSTYTLTTINNNPRTVSRVSTVPFVQAMPPSDSDYDSDDSCNSYNDICTYQDCKGYNDNCYGRHNF